MNVYENYDLLAEDIGRQADLIRGTRTWFTEVTREAASRVRKDIERIYLVGCGDSLDVGNATRFTWESLLEIPVEAVPALTFSRYSVRSAPETALVVALSQSGKVSRVTESVRVARDRGLQTIAATGSAGSPLAREQTTATIMTPFPKIGPIPGTSSYTFNMALFYELGAALAEAWGRDSSVITTIRKALDLLPSLIDSSLPGVWETARRHAADTADRSLVHMALGAGPNLATARFTVRKLYEVPQVPAMSQETEEYAHDQYSMVGPRTPTWLYAPPGTGSDRDAEIYASLVNLGAPTAVITEEGLLPTAPSQPSWRYQIASGPDDLLSPLLYSLPSQVYCCELARQIGGSFYGNADEVHRTEGDPLIYESAIIA